MRPKARRAMRQREGQEVSPKEVGEAVGFEEQSAVVFHSEAVIAGGLFNGEGVEEAHKKRAVALTTTARKIRYFYR